MKRTLPLFLTVALMFTLAACGNTPEQGNDASSPAPEAGAPASGAPETPPANPPEDTAPTEEQTPEGTGDGGKKTLIAYFSATNTTEGIANHLDTILDAGLYKIVPETPYTSDDLNYNDSNSRSSQEMDDPGARPAISGGVDNMEEYGVIFLGYPIWWASIPMPVASFLEEYDFSGKTIIPFCSHGGGRFGQSLTAITKLAPDAVLGEGLAVSCSGGSGLSGDVAAWLEENNIPAN